MKLSIRSKLFVGFALLLTLSFLIQAVAFNITRNYIITQTNNLHFEKAQFASEKIKDFIGSLDSYSKGLSTSYKESSIEGTQEDVKRIISFVLANNDFIREITFISLDGVESFKIDKYGQFPPEELGQTEITDEFVNARAGERSISKAYFLESKPGAFVDYYAPVFLQTTKLKGITKFQISLEKLWGLISQIKLGQNGFTYIVDNYGKRT